MTEPKWLIQSVIETIHDMQVAEHGGLSSIRDKGLLNSALARPQNLYEPNLYKYQQADLYHLAAAYAVALVRNHPFIDGNKRTAFVAALVFLNINGIKFTAPEAETTAMVIALAADKLDQSQFAKWLKQHSETKLNQ